MTVEERLAALEADVQEMKFILPSRIDAFASALSQTHAELLAFRAETRAEFKTVNARFDGVNERLDELTGLVRSLVERDGS